MTGDSAGGRPSTRGVDTTADTPVSYRVAGGQRADGAGYQLTGKPGRNVRALFDIRQRRLREFGGDRDV